MSKERIKEIRTVLEAERISYGEILEVQIAAQKSGIKVTDDMLTGDLLDALEEVVEA